ncbi:MAG: hypothetical protein DI640_12950 [Sphingomonas taxi]|uniref:DUF927 domain-containing protein n=1 Tax=Sphingomonas taxi TaxID=1549858 RepID=A0A2W4YT76_9SPHN|nr:MAG: hypothetical protein DI640_12950 [Sphingomonas taxi]
MEDWGTFFRAVLPAIENGVYFIARGELGKNPDRVIGTTLDELIRVANDRQQTGDTGLNEYYRVAAYQPGAISAKTASIHSNKAFMLDIDVRENEPLVYSTKAEALTALVTQIANGNLPEPTYMIDSGRGFHVYWAIKDGIDNLSYRRRAAALADKIVALDAKLGKDAAVTKSGVNLLRLPGSVNPNNGARVDHLRLPDGDVFMRGPIYDPDDVAPDPNPSAMAGGGALTNIVPFPGAAGPLRSITQPTADLDTAEDLSTGCNLLRFVRTRDDIIGYNAWWRILKLLSYTKDGAQKVHDWFATSPKYAPADTEKQMGYLIEHKSDAGPPFCETLAQEVGIYRGCASGQHRDLCVGCPFYNPAEPDKYSPYNAGKKVETDRAAAQARDTIAKPPSLNAVVVPQLGHAALPPADLVPARQDDQFVTQLKLAAATLEADGFLPVDMIGMKLDHRLFEGHELGFKVNEVTGELFWYPPRDKKASEDDPDPDPVKVCNGVIWPIRYVAVPGSDRANLQVAIARVENDVWVGRYAILDYKVYGSRTDSFVTELGGLKVMLTQHQGAQRAFQGLFRRRVGDLQDRHTLTQFQHFGWNQTPRGKAFVTGNFAFLDGQVEVASLGDNLRSLRERMFKLNGSVETVKRALQEVWDQGSDEFRLCVMLGVGAPFTYKTSVNGIFVTIYGSTGQGKSLVASTVSGIWGNGDTSAAHITTNDTTNARYAVLEQMHNLPVIHDEITNLFRSFNYSPDCGHYIYEVVNGNGKNRSTKTGGLQEMRRWSTLLLGTSNVSLRSVVTAMDDATDAQLARVYEIGLHQPAAYAQLPAADRNARMTALGNTLHSCEGVAGFLIGQYISANREQLEVIADQLMETIIKSETTTDGTARTDRSVKTAAFLGGHIMRQLGFWNCSMHDIQAVVDRAHAAVITERGKLTRDPLEVLPTLVHRLQANTALVHIVPPGIQAMSKLAPGVLSEPRFELKQRIEFVSGTGHVTVTIELSAFRRFLEENNISEHYIVNKMRASGYKFDFVTAVISDGINLPSRDNVKSISVALPPVRCVQFQFVTDPLQIGLSTIPPMIAPRKKA